MLTAFTMAVPIPNKNSETIYNAYRDNIYCTFGGSSRILTDNGSEFKNKEMQQVCETLGVKHIFSPVYMPESNGRLEGWHRFFKACIAKHIHGEGVEWDELVPLAVSTYNFLPFQSSKESPFVLMFGRDPIAPVAKLLEPRPRYYGYKGSAVRMDTLRRLYTIVEENIRKAREKRGKVPKEKKPHTFRINDMVLVRDPDSAVFEPRYQPNYRVTAISGDNRIKVQDEKGHKSVRRSSHIKYVEPAEKLVQQLPGKETLQKYGRSSKLLIAARDIPDLGFKLKKTEKSDDVQEIAENALEGTDEVQEVKDNLSLSMTIETLCVDLLKTSESCEHSGNSLNSIMHVTQNFTNQEKVTKIIINQKPQEIYSENCNCSQNSLSKGTCVTNKLKTEEMGVTSQDVTKSNTRENCEESRKS